MTGRFTWLSEYRRYADLSKFHTQTREADAISRVKREGVLSRFTPFPVHRVICREFLLTVF